ncbi:PIR Superfamily Protein [Plasmodium ovale curtisi]|uniref:PIR Superfamily Protein n=1 Tax=Plasmodium ovale curtisi TaxID=864141 RepID=A0A1A8WBC2_PLAOA|nr:PIR Superfamily Protein [Plasmodium ovale curtisi]
MDIYLSYGSMADITTAIYKYDSSCNSSLSKITESKKEIVNICNKFKYIFKLLSSYPESHSQNEEQYFSYINYCLNGQLYKTATRVNIKVDEVYRKLIGTDNDFVKINKLQGKIRNMNEHDLKEIDKQNSYYSIYNKISKILILTDESTCIQILKQLNQSLYKFKDKYEELNNRIFQPNKCKTDNIQQLALYKPLALPQDVVTAGYESHLITPEASNNGTSTTLIVVLGLLVRVYAMEIMVTSSNTKMVTQYHMDNEDKNESWHTSEFERTNSEKLMYTISYNSV